jgi:hypothetical protein
MYYVYLFIHDNIILLAISILLICWILLQKPGSSFLSVTILVISVVVVGGGFYLGQSFVQADQEAL